MSGSRGRGACKVLLVDEEEIFLVGLQEMLTQMPGCRVTDRVKDARAAVEAARREHVDLIIIEVVMSGMSGVEATRLIRSQPLATRVLCLSRHREARFVTSALEAGAAGYLLKDCTFEELSRAVDSVLAGQTYLSPLVAGPALEAWRRGPSSRSAHPSLLSGREREVLQLVAEGMTVGKIASRLCLSTKTIHSHRRRVMEKLDVGSVAGLVKYAIREGLTSSEP